MDIISKKSHKVIFLFSYYKNNIISNPTVKQYIEKYINLPLFTIFLNHLVTKSVTSKETNIAII